MRCRWAAGLMVLVLTGCFSFSGSATAAPGETARLTLTTTRPVGDGTQEPLTVEGKVVSSSLGEEPATRSSILLEQQTKQTFGRFREVVTLDTVQILAPDIEELEVRRVSWIKSAVGIITFGFLGYALASTFEPSFEGR